MRRAIRCCEIGYLSSEGTRVRRRGSCGHAGHDPRSAPRGSEGGRSCTPSKRARLDYPSYGIPLRSPAVFNLVVLVS